jgi:hypothetical protein
MKLEKPEKGLDTTRRFAALTASSRVLTASFAKIAFR